MDASLPRRLVTEAIPRRLVTGAVGPGGAAGAGPVNRMSAPIGAGEQAGGRPVTRDVTKER
jgi:hypothetical protein